MKILHTADWHLGNVLYSYERINEEEFCLKQLSDIVKKEQPDCMVVSGDVFNNIAPKASVQKLYVQSMLKIHEACPTMTIVVTSGNHDSPSKLEVDSSLWEYFNLFVVGNIKRNDGEIDYQEHIIPIKDKYQKIIGYVAAVPFFYQRNAPDFINNLLKYLNEINTDNLPVVLSNHAAITSCEIKSKALHVQDFEFIEFENIVPLYDYMALGHIHYPQTLKNTNNKARYAGSPLAVSFNEDYRHSVTIVDIEKNIKNGIRTIDIEDKAPLVNIPKEHKIFSEALFFLSSTEEFKGKYICLNVLIEDFLPFGAKQHAIEICNKLGAKFCTFDIQRIIDKENKNSFACVTTEEFKNFTPVYVAKKYFESQNIELNADFEKMIIEAQNFDYSNNNIILK